MSSSGQAQLQQQQQQQQQQQSQLLLPPLPPPTPTATTATTTTTITTASTHTQDSNPYQFITLNQSPRQRTTRNYVLKLRQQPKHSRMCGFGEKVDRRPLDPPPIIQLEIKSTSFADENSYLYNPYYFMYASLIAPESEEELHLLRDGKTRSTTGSIVSSLYRLKDLDNKDGAFFVFPDLSVRMEGTYRLKFSLFEIINTEIYHCTSICSDIFNVYPAKKFPGMEESTFLSRTFAEQGLKIRIRKELRMRKGRGKKGNHDPDDSADGGKKRSRKKGRRGSAGGSDNGSESGYSDEARPDSAQRRRTSHNKGSSSKDAAERSGHPQQPYPAPGYDRGYDPSRQPGGMGHPDPRHYGHMPHDPSGHPYPHYGPMGPMPPKVWHGHGDPYQGGMPPHGYQPMPPHYDPNASYQQPPVGGGPSGPDQDGQYPVPYNPSQRPLYPPPPHMYQPRDHEGGMMDWHHRDYRGHPGYGPAPGQYMPAHPYEDPNVRSSAPQGPGQPPSDHATIPPQGAPNPYYGHHQGGPPKHGDYKTESGHAQKYAPNYGFNQNFHVPGPGDLSGRPPPPPQHAQHGEHGPPHMQHDKAYVGATTGHYVGHPGYYGSPYASATVPPGGGPPQPGGLPYPYSGGHPAGNAPGSHPSSDPSGGQGPNRDQRSGGHATKLPNQDDTHGGSFMQGPAGNGQPSQQGNPQQQNVQSGGGAMSQAPSAQSHIAGPGGSAGSSGPVSSRGGDGTGNWM
ncbi:hypothetical protein PhCBS80983_g02910 [Powellomyces hirtus]|uniref:Velvet domain-containing protein n=1 Tax=Powellomyces hirtus TaxID=109895 RepID=A0A507E4N8_9FUNG|nr:hypothetical protein PhCBS80983_g02910 [Powellomyces hirtus]